MKNSGKPAFPLEREEITAKGEKFIRTYGGLTKREYFAGLALQGLLANHMYFHDEARFENVAMDAVRLADELLNQLEQ